MDRDQLEECFTLYDTVGDNKIEMAQLGQTIRGLGLNPTNAEINKITKEIDDKSGTKRVSFEEFVPIYESLAAQERSVKSKYKDEFAEMLRVFDREQNGTVSMSELHHVMTTLGEALSSDELTELDKDLEVDKQGLVNFDSYSSLVLDG